MPTPSIAYRVVRDTDPARFWPLGHLDLGGFRADAPASVRASTVPAPAYAPWGGERRLALDALIDRGEERGLVHVRIRASATDESGASAPHQVLLLASHDGVSWTPCSPVAVAARYIMVRIATLDTSPAGDFALRIESVELTPITH